MDTPSFADGLGRRLPLLGTSGERLESLRLCPEFGDTPLTRAALVERAALLSGFQSPAFARVLRVEHLDGIGGGLSIVSEAPAGVRLSDLLRQAERRTIELDPNAALFLIQQIALALAALHASGREASHGALGPERVVVAPDGSPVLAEYVLATALEGLQYSRAQLWALFRVPVPAVAGAVRFDQQTDVVQLGVLALALLLGRVLLRDEFPQRLPVLLDEAATLDAFREHGGLSRPIRSWVARALQLDSRTTFRTAVEAEAALALALAEDKTCRPSAAALQAFLSRCCSLEDSPASGVAAQRRATPAGAVVSIPPRPDVTVRLSAKASDERPFDRGSGAQRVTLGGPAPEPTSVQVLADVSDLPSSHQAPAPEHVVPADARTRRPTAAADPQSGNRWAALRRMLRVGGMVLVLVLLFGASFLGARAYLRLPPIGRATGTVVVDSRPAGLELLVDGEPRGRTPVTLELSAGNHALAVRTARGVTEVPITVAPGQQQAKIIDVRHTVRPARRRIPGK